MEWAIIIVCSLATVAVFIQIFFDYREAVRKLDRMIGTLEEKNKKA
jgi:hypothetical protein